MAKPDTVPEFEIVKDEIFFVTGSQGKIQFSLSMLSKY